MHIGDYVRAVDDIAKRIYRAAMGICRIMEEKRFSLATNLLLKSWTTFLGHVFDSCPVVFTVDIHLCTRRRAVSYPPPSYTVYTQYKVYHPFKKKKSKENVRRL